MDSSKLPLQLCADCPINKGWSRAMVFLIFVICSIAVILTLKNGISESSIIGLLTLATLVVGFIDRSLKQTAMESKQNTTQDALQQVAAKVDVAAEKSVVAAEKAVELKQDLATNTKITAETKEVTAELNKKADVLHDLANGVTQQKVDQAFQAGREKGREDSNLNL